MSYLFITGFSALFVLIGFLVTENNAKNILSGYNTMSEEERKNFMLEDFIQFFRNFHIFLGLSFFLLSIFVYEFLDDLYQGLFMSIYPIVLYSYMIFNTRNYYIDRSKHKSWKENIAVMVMFAVIIFILGIMYYSYTDNEIYIDNKTLIIKGIYGEEIPLETILVIDSIKSIPELRTRKNGVSINDILKGDFIIEDKTKALMIINKEANYFLEISLKNGEIVILGDKYNKLKPIYDEFNK